MGVSAPAQSVAIAPDGKTLATGAADARVQVWDLTRKKKMRTLEVPPSHQNPRRNGVGTVAFSPDGKLLAAGFGTRTWFDGQPHDQWACVWDWASGQRLAVLPHKNTVAGVAFSRDGRFLATASHDFTVRLWSVGDWRATRHWSGPDFFTSVAFAPDSATLAAGCCDGLIRIWKLDTSAAAVAAGAAQWPQQLRHGPVVRSRRPDTGLGELGSHAQVVGLRQRTHPAVVAS